MGVSNDDATSVNNVFLRNRYCYANIPMFMSFRFHVLGTIRWNIDAVTFGMLKYRHIYQNISVPKNVFKT